MKEFVLKCRKSKKYKLKIVEAEHLEYSRT